MIGRGIAASRGKALARAMAAETQQQIDLEKKSKENLRGSYVVQVLCIISDRLRKINFMLP